jgi:PTH1 family peptidyl-tRNA hydrolase
LKAKKALPHPRRPPLPQPRSLTRKNKPVVKLIVGLGNPGSRYAHTRHNAGRLLVESICWQSGLTLKVQKSLKASMVSTQWDSEEVSLACPETFMNVSGEAVSLLARHFSLDIGRDLLIVVDEVALPFGKWRLRSKGSDGGHNGLKSVAEALTSPDYPRLRMGIGPSEAALSAQGKLNLEQFVLESFDPEESRELAGILERGREACRLWALSPIADAMNAVNG